jgi:tetratricopeptide (TPR) repeat protein
MEDELQRVVAACATRMQSDKSSDRLDQLNSAIDFLTAVRDADLDGEMIRAALVDTMLDRAMFMVEEYGNHDDARIEAQQALAIAPGTPRAIAMHYRENIILAREKFNADRHDLVRALLKEANDLYADAEKSMLVSRDMEEWKKKADGIQELIDIGERPEAADETPAGARDHKGRSPGSDDQAFARLGRLVDGMEGPDASTSASSDLFSEALIRRSRKEYEGAIELYKQLRDQNPSDQHIRSNLERCYRAWIYHLMDSDASREEVGNVVRQALESCPGSELLSDLRELVNGDTP